MREAWIPLSLHYYFMQFYSLRCNYAHQIYSGGAVGEVEVHGLGAFAEVIASVFDDGAIGIEDGDLRSSAGAEVYLEFTGGRVGVCAIHGHLGFHYIGVHRAARGCSGTCSQSITVRQVF